MCETFSFLLLCALGMTMVTSGFPQSPLSLRTATNLDEAQQHNSLFPSTSLSDWSIQRMSAPNVAAGGNGKEGLMRDEWLLGPDRTQARRAQKMWPSDWSSRGEGLVKRNMVVADDVAFRERSKLLTSMERQKWLNSYMQKLLVVDSS